MGWIPDNVIEAMRGNYMLSIFLRVDTDPALHVWFGVNDIPASIDSIDDQNTVYLGGGRLIGIPSLEVLVNGTSDAVDFTISGVDPSTSAKLIDSLPPVRGAKVHIGLTTLDEYYQPMSGIIPIWWGTASHLSEQSSTTVGENPTSLTLSLSVSTGEATRSRPSYALWTDIFQKQISSDDDFCRQVSRLSRGVAPVWPNY